MMNGKKITFLGVSSGICAPTAKGQIGAELGFEAIRAHALTARKPDHEDDFDPRRIFIDNETENIVTPKDLYDYIDEMDNSDIFFQDLEQQPDNSLDNRRFARHIGYLSDIFKKIKSKVYETLKYNEFPFLIAGDHSTSAATIGGIQRYMDKYATGKKLGIIWIDAHVDAHSPFSTPSGNMHGMPVGMACGIESNLDPLKDLSHDKIRRDVIRKEDILDKWRKLFVDPKDVKNLKNYDFVYIGIRDYQPHETKFLLGRDTESKPGTRPEAKRPTRHYKYSDGEDMQGNIKAFFSQMRDENNVEKTLTEICHETIAYFKENHYDYLYISFDIDSISGVDLKETKDQSAAFDSLTSHHHKAPIYGTGTPEPHGMSVEEIKTILHYFIHIQKEIPIIAFEIVEVSPLLDIQNQTAEISFDIITTLLNPTSFTSPIQ